MAALNRSQVRAQIKQRSGRSIMRDGSDVVLTMDYSLFLKELVFEAGQLAKKDGSRQILPSHMLRVKEKLLKKYRG